MCYLKISSVCNWAYAGCFGVGKTLLGLIYEGWNFNSGNYLFTTDTK